MVNIAYECHFAPIEVTVTQHEAGSAHNIGKNSLHLLKNDPKDFVLFVFTDSVLRDCTDVLVGRAATSTLRGESTPSLDIHSTPERL